MRKKLRNVLDVEVVVLFPKSQVLAFAADNAVVSGTFPKIPSRMPSQRASGKAWSAGGRRNSAFTKHVQLVPG